MGLLTFIQIPCHHVLANEIALNLNYRIVKQIFDINLGIGIIKKTTFVSYFRHTSLCFYSNFGLKSSLDVELNSASNEYPLSILLTDPTTPKKRNTWKNVMMTCTRWMQNLILHPTSSPNWNLTKNTGRYVKNTNKKVVFCFYSSKINKYYFINFF